MDHLSLACGRTVKTQNNNCTYEDGKTPPSMASLLSKKTIDLRDLLIKRIQNQLSVLTDTLQDQNAFVRYIHYQYSKLTFGTKTGKNIFSLRWAKTVYSSRTIFLKIDSSANLSIGLNIDIRL